MVIFLLLLVPLLAAVGAFAARRRSVMEGINLCAAVLTFVLAVILAGSILKRGVVSAMSGLLYADALSALVVLLVAFVYVACAVYAVGYFRDDETSGVFEEDVLGTVLIGKLRKYYVLTPLFVASMLLVALSNNLGIMWVAIEGTTLASVFLVTFYGRANSLEAAWKYAIIGGVGLSMALFGTILTYYLGTRGSGNRDAGGIELVCACNEGFSIRSHHHAPRVHLDSAWIWDQSRDRADAYMEAGRVQ